jgi:hypothetical protein
MLTAYLVFPIPYKSLRNLAASHRSNSTNTRTSINSSKPQ